MDPLTLGWYPLPGLVLLLFSLAGLVKRRRFRTDALIELLDRAEPEVRFIERSQAR